MKYYLLGKSGLRVSELALGAMSFGTEWGWGTEIDEAKPAGCSIFISITAETSLIRQASTPMAHPKRCWESFLGRSAGKSSYPPNTRSVPIPATPMVAATIARAWFGQSRRVFKDSKRIASTCSTCTSGTVRHRSKKFCERWMTLFAREAEILFAAGCRYQCSVFEVRADKLRL